MRLNGCVAAVICFVLLIGFQSRHAFAQSAGPASQPHPGVIGVDDPGALIRPAPPRPVLPPDESDDFPPIANHSRHVWTELPPVWRTNHSLAYDSRRDRFLVVGGGSGDLWELRVRPGVAWRRLDRRRDAPDARTMVAAYDAGNDRLLAYAQGYSEGRQTSGLWALPLKTGGRWEQLVGAGVLPITTSPAMAFDGNDRVFLLASNSLWQVRIGYEVQVGPVVATGTAPAGLDNALVFDPVRNQLLTITSGGKLFPLALGAAPAWGEAIQTGYVYGSPTTRRLLLGSDPDEVLVLDGYGYVDAVSLVTRTSRTVTREHMVEWTRRSFAAACDPIGRSIVVHGGENLCASTRSDAEKFDLAGSQRWQLLGPRSGGRNQNHVAVIDHRRDRMLVVNPFGDQHTIPGTVLVRDLSDDDNGMIEVPPAAPLPQGIMWQRSMFMDELRDRVVLLGRTLASGLWRFWQTPAAGAPDWQGREMSGEAPRGEPGTVGFDEVRDRILVFGASQAGPGPYAHSMWELSLATLNWRRHELARALPIGYGWTVLDTKNNNAWFYSYLDSLYELDLATDPIQVTTHAVENEMRHYAFVPVFFDPAGSSVVGFHGFYPIGYDFSDFSSLVRLKVGPHAKWERIPTEGSIPSSRDLYSIIHDEKRERLVIYAGYDEECGYFDNSFALSLRGLDPVSQADPGEAQPAAAPAPGRLSLHAGAGVITGPLELSFSLGTSEPARIDILDVAGRRVLSKDLAPGGSRSSVVRLAEARSLSPGVYFARLRQGGAQARVRFVVLP